VKKQRRKTALELYREQRQAAARNGKRRARPEEATDEHMRGDAWEPPAGSGEPSDPEPDIDGTQWGTLMSDVAPEMLVWLWAGRIPLGKLTILDGDPDLGKSTLTLDLAARVTRNWKMPDDTPGVDGGVILLTAEDAAGDTIRPRLDAAGADPARVMILDRIPDGNATRLPILPNDISYLRDAIRSMRAKLVVVDPIMAFLAGEVNSHRDQDVRRALAPLAKLAEEEGCAIVVVRHLNKGDAVNPLHRGGGSIGIIGAARSGLLVTADPDNPDRRVLASTKCNLAKRPPSLAFDLSLASNGSIRVGWIGPSEHTADALLSAPRGEEERGKVEEAVDWLRQFLTGGRQLKADVRTAAIRLGITDITLRRARERLGIKIEREGFGPGLKFYWALPDDGEEIIPHTCSTPGD
jgi:hypothetical protein